MKAYLSLILFFLFGVNAFSQNQNFDIKLKSKTFTPAERVGFEDALQVRSSESPQGYIYRLVQFYTIPTTAEKLKLNAAGIELISYIPNNAYISKVSTSVSKTDLVEMNIRSIHIIENDMKLAPVLIKQDFPDWAVTGEYIRLNVKYYSELDKSSLLNNISENEGQVLGQLDKIKTLVVQYPTLAISELASNPLIQWIEPISAPNKSESTIGNNTFRSNAINTQYLEGRKYDGRGITIGLADDGVIGPHIDFEGRATINTIENAGIHGDMTSGIAVGAGNLDPTVGGTAPGADLQVFRIGNLIFLSSNGHILNAVENLNNLDITITSTSYSQGFGGEYNTTTEFADQQVYENPVIAHVFAGGNSGTQDHGYGAGPGWGNISGGMKAGKNTVCVGNLDLNDNLIFSSSIGPAADGRIKPDICAIGDGNYSTNENNTFQRGSGTSAACPAIAGIFAQLSQAYKENNDDAVPESGLIKAAILNTAEDLGNPGPDFRFGWGRANALKAARIIEDKRYMSDNMEQGLNQTHLITVPENVSELRIMTYWTDLEGSPNSALALVNDINMQVVSPSGDVYNPWILDPTPDPTALNTEAIRGIDNLNNMEQVTLGQPVAGEYMVNLDGFSIPQGPQKYYVLYDFIFDEVELTYPLGGEGFVPGETEIITWDASESDAPFTVEYTLDGGATFINIGTIQGNNRRLEWFVPDVISNEVKIQISREGSTSISNENFTIVDAPINLEIVRVCPDTVEFTWDPVDEIEQYEISQLGEKYMDSIGFSNTNSFIITGLNPNEDHWFSVRSLVSGSKGRRAFAVNKPPGTANCVLNNDVEMVQLISPFEGGVTSCTDSENTRVSLRIANLGLESVSNIDLNYQINNEPVVTESFTTDLITGEEDNFTFTTLADLSGLESYEIAIWASLSNDENFFNDTLRENSRIFQTEVVSTFPLNENFQDFTLCSAGITCEAIVCNLDNSWTNFTNLEEDDIDWRTDSGGTGTTETGPEVDYDRGTSSGKYLYLEGSQGCNLREAVLFSPCIDLTNASCAEFEFAYHMFGVNIGELHVDVVSKDESFLDVMDPIIGNQGNQWRLVHIDLSPFVGEIINIKITGTIGNGVRSDIAIDAMSINVDEPTASFSFDDGGIGEPIYFSNSSIGGIDSYLWNFGDGTSSPDLNPVHIYSEPGIYDVQLIVTGFCGSDTLTQQLEINISTSTSETENIASGIEIYPNPTNDNFTIQFPSQLLNQEVDIRLRGIHGKLIADYSSLNLTEEIKIDDFEAPNGMYFIEISNKNFKVIRKLIKQ